MQSRWRIFHAFATLILQKEIQILGFPWCSTREDLSINVSITNVGLILTKLWWFLFSGCGQTDGRTRFWNPHMETCRPTKNFNSKLKGSTTFVPIHDWAHTTVPTHFCVKTRLSPDAFVPWHLICAQTCFCPGTLVLPTWIIVARYDQVLGQ